MTQQRQSFGPGRVLAQVTRQILHHPRHPYTVALMESVPKLGEKRERLYQIQGQPPDLLRLPPGCPFYERCPLRMDICLEAFPPATPLDDDGYVHCWAVGSGDPETPARSATLDPGQAAR